MKREEDDHKGKGREVVDNENDPDDKRGSLASRVNFGQDVDNLNVHEDSDDGQGQHEPEVVAVVAFTHADTDPGTVVIKPLHTGIANRTMRSSWGSIYVAGVAKFDF